MRCKTVLVLLASVLGGCAQLMQGPSLAGYPGLQYQIETFYDNRALEWNATCTQPRMSVSGYQVVEDTPVRLVLNVRYHYSDNSRGPFEGGPFGLPRAGLGRCNDWATRTFVVVKSQGGPPGSTPALAVQSMTGPQRELPPNSAVR
jgi:hypothetical protein